MAYNKGIIIALLDISSECDIINYTVILKNILALMVLNLIDSNLFTI